MRYILCVVLLAVVATSMFFVSRLAEATCGDRWEFVAETYKG